MRECCARPRNDSAWLRDTTTRQARRGEAWPGEARQARLGMARRGVARRGWAWRGEVRQAW